MDNSDHYEDLVVRRSDNYGHIIKGLELVSAYVKKNKLVLVGGMAIDIALKDAGHEGIYCGNKLPDIDFLSSDTVRDGAAIGEECCRAGLPNISIINAIHTTTRRVRIDTVTVADIGYCPSIENVPTMEADGFKIVHPHFQIMDIHRALSYPFEDPVRPVISHRWARDCRRYDIIMEVFPIQVAKSAVKMVNVVAAPDVVRGSCLTGWAALSYYRDGKLDTFKVPVGEPIHLHSDNFVEVAGKNGTHIESRLGKMRRSIEFERSGVKYEVFDNLGEKVAATEVAKGIWVANLQNVMLWLLVRLYLYNCAEMCDTVRAAYHECSDMVRGGNGPDAADVYGKESWGTAKVIARERQVARVSGKPLPKSAPKNMYPSRPKCDSMKPFDYSTSPYFALSGRRSKTPFKPIKIDSF
jgi:hypothetical protein